MEGTEVLTPLRRSRTVKVHVEQLIKQFDPHIQKFYAGKNSKGVCLGLKWNDGIWCQKSTVASEVHKTHVSVTYIVYEVH
jgi:hypothetical protein